MNADVIVVGGGAAGLMAAGTAAARGLRVVLCEPNRRLGRKLRITGKGRCNVCNACTVEEAVAAIPNGGRFLYGAFSRFGPRDVMTFFEDLGVPLKIERGRRVFPVSDRADDIADALGRWVLAQGVQVISTAAREILTKNGKVCGVLAADGNSYSAQAAILATGGASYPGTGSTGDGYRMAQGLGHRVREIRPSLVPLAARGDVCARLQGLSLRNCGVKVTAAGQKKPVYEDFGELLFTHFGLSGPTVLSASCHMRGPGPYTVHIDLKPALDEQKLDARLLRDLSQSPNRSLGNSLSALLPRSLIPVALERAGLSPGLPCHELTRAQRHALLAGLKDFSVEIAGLRPLAEGIVTAGGVDLKEIDPRSMESKRVPGLYFAGELIDADAYTGGYNLQIAWSTGRAAGRSVCDVISGSD